MIFLLNRRCVFVGRDLVAVQAITPDMLITSMASRIYASPLQNVSYWHHTLIQVLTEIVYWCNHVNAIQYSGNKVLLGGPKVLLDLLSSLETPHYTDLDFSSLNRSKCSINDWNTYDIFYLFGGCSCELLCIIVYSGFQTLGPYCIFPGEDWSTVSLWIL